MINDGNTNTEKLGSMAADLSPEARELNLVGKVEMRIALADSDTKLQSLLSTYLAPLLLKLLSEHLAVRNKVIAVCKHVTTRLSSSPTVALPLHALQKQFCELDNGLVAQYRLVREFDLHFLRQGLQRLSPKEAIEILPELLRNAPPQNEISGPEWSDRFTIANEHMWHIAFHLLLQTLPLWRFPERGSKEAVALTGNFNLSQATTDSLAYYLSRFLLYDGQSTTNATERSLRRNTSLYGGEVKYMAQYDTAAAKTGVSLSKTKASVANFLFTSIFSDFQRFSAAVILTADTANLDAFRIGDTMFKQCTFDLESRQYLSKLTRLYLGVGPRQPPSAKLRIRVLALLSKSKEITGDPAVVLDIVKQQLFSDEDQSTGGLEATKMRSALFSFLNWVVRVGQDKDLLKIAPSVMQSLREFIETQGWPSPDTTGVTLTPGEVDLRGKTYESIGVLAAKLDPNIELVTWLFTSLRCDLSGVQIHVSIEEALGRVLNVFAKRVQSHENRNDLLAELRQLLLWNMTSGVGDADPVHGFATRRSTKYATVRYANRCLDFDDVDARSIDLLAISQAGDRQEMLEEGTKGLDPYWYQTSRPAAMGEMRVSLEYPDFSQVVERCLTQDAGSVLMVALQAHEKHSFSSAVVFCRNILVVEALKGTNAAITAEPEWGARISGLLTTDHSTRKALKAHMATTEAPALLQLLRSSFLGMSSNIGQCGDVAVELSSLCPNRVLAALQEEDLVLVKNAALANNLITQSQASRVFGTLGSLSLDLGMANLPGMIDACEHWAETTGQQLNKLRGTLLSANFLLTRLTLRGSQPSENVFDKFTKLLSDILTESRDLALRDAASTSIGQVYLCSDARPDIGEVSGTILDSLVKDARKEKEVAVAALGRIAYAQASHGSDTLVNKTLEHLYALQDIKRPEVHFAVGEALAGACTGWRSTSLITEFDVDADPPVRDINSTLLQTVLGTVIENCKTTKPSLKKAAAIWLLSLVQYCGREDPVRSQLRQCQIAFSRLLSDRDEIVQESGSRGLGLVYEMGDERLREDLVRDLVQSFTSTNTSKVTSGSVNEDTELFEAGALPTGEGSITTYKDIVSLANEMGDPSLVYRFMNLASNNAIWTSRAAFGRFGLGSVLADSTYLKENKKFYPKLYRYRFDPNPNVQRSMNEIWRALVKDPNTVIDQNFEPILEDLLKSILGKEWRVREASCAAIADLVQGREVEKYEGYLEQIWNVAFKVLDDIKETVRIAAMTLCRTLTNLLIRNLEVGEGTSKRATKLLEHAMPFLLQQLESGAAQEVQQYAIVTLLQIVKKSPPKGLRPFAPVIIETLVNSLSSLEHESINYLHLNAEKYGLTAEKLDKMRVSSMSSSPLTEAIDRCLESLDTSTTESKENANEAMRRLEGTFKTALGLPSKVGLSRVLVTLTVRHSLFFKPYADRFVQLVRKHMLDRNETVSVAYSMSLAYMMRLASDKQVDETVLHAKALYFGSEESSHRVVAAEIVHAIAKVSNDVFMRFATVFLPLAFIGRQDDEQNVKTRFDEAWKDNVGGSGAVALYLTEIVTLISAHIHSTHWAIKHACCLAVADMVTLLQAQGEYSATQARSVWPVLEAALSGKTWEGKEKVVSSLPKYVRGAKCLWTDGTNWTQTKSIALREARRTNAGYRPYAIAALGEIAATRRDLDLSSELVPLAEHVVEEILAEKGDQMDVDSTDKVAQQAR